MHKRILIAIFSATLVTSGLPGISIAQNIPVSSVLTPFDTNTQDVGNPAYWRSRYGKAPEIIVASNGSELDVFAQDYDTATAWSSVLLHIEPGAGGGYEVTQALTNIPMLDRVMGLAADDSGNRYYATGVDEASQITVNYPPDNTYRNDIVRVVKIDPAGNVQFNIDLDTARHAFNSNAEMIINPMTFASSRLAVGGGEIALLHSINTEPDSGGTRHQKALSTRLDAANGDITKTAGPWMSHSFDQRLLFDGTDITELHLGDAYQRTIELDSGKTNAWGGAESSSLFHIKGPLGQNETHTKLGNMALIENDPDYGYIALFSTESNDATSGSTAIMGPRNLAIVRVDRTDNSIDPNLPDTLTVTSSGVQKTNHLKWLTSYTDYDDLHAERPKLIGIGADRYIVLWEEWTATAFQGVYGMVIDDQGDTIQGAKLITDQQHLSRGDDAFLLNNRAAWMTGSSTDKALYIHFVDTSLNYQKVKVGDTGTALPMPISVLYLLL